MKIIQNLDFIKSNLDLVAVMSRTTTLKPSGSKLVCSCPFHTEKTPSCYVDAQTQHFHCFGCGVQGDVFDFEMKRTGQSFPEVVQTLANDFGLMLDLGPENMVQTEDYRRKEQMFVANAVVLKCLQETSKLPVRNGLVDLAGRSFQAEAAEHFRVTIWPFSNILLEQHYAWGLDKAVLEDVGLIRAGRSAGYDFFKGRIIFPICDEKGKVSGFSGRKMDNQNPKSPKYLNSPESAVFKKSHLLFGLSENKGFIRECGTAILTEGYTDVLRLWENGFKNAVAACGTALSESHALMLKKHADTILLLPDGDSAGQNAAHKAIEVLEKVGLFVQLCSLPSEQDPESFVRMHGAERFKEYLSERTQDAIVWLSGQWATEVRDKPTEKQKRVEQVRSYFQTTQFDSMVHQWANQVSQILDVPPSVFLPHQVSPEQPPSAAEGNSVIFEQDNCYFRRIKKGTPVQITNFVIRPLYFFKGSPNSGRLCQIINLNAEHHTVVLDGKSLNSVEAFRLAIERYGNFLFLGKMPDLTLIKDTLYADFADCHEIKVLGYQKDWDFWAWSNLLQTTDRLVPFNDHGVAEVAGQHFHLNLASSDHLQAHSAGSLELGFRYKKSSITLPEWCRLMTKAYPENSNGTITSLFFLASVFSDIVFDSLRFFPLLFAFGPPKTGKSTLASSLSRLYGTTQNQMSLTMATPQGLLRRAAAFCNRIVWFDEYKDHLPPRTIEFLKGLYDRSGYVRAEYSNDNRTNEVETNACFFITGQELPTADPALASRCILLRTSKTTFSEEVKEHFHQLQNIEAKEGLSYLTGEVFKHRQLVKHRFETEFNCMYQALGAKLAAKCPGTVFDERQLKNSAVLLTILEILHDPLHLPASFRQEGEQAVFTAIERQCHWLESHDDVAEFWEMVKALIDSNQITNSKELWLVKKTSITLIDRAKEAKKLSFGAAKELLLLRFMITNKVYQQFFKASHNRNGLPMATLKQYLESHPAYLGYCNACRFPDSQNGTSCMVFDNKLLGIDLNLHLSDSGESEDD